MIFDTTWFSIPDTRLRAGLQSRKVGCFYGDCRKANGDMSDRAELPTTRRHLIKTSAALLGYFLAPGNGLAQPGEGRNGQAAKSEQTMRMMMRLTIPVEKGNEAAASGTMDQVIDHIIETLRPEAAYFHLDGGRRAATFIYEAEKAEEMAVINEPIFRALNASIDQQPVLTAADIGKALHAK